MTSVASEYPGTLLYGAVFGVACLVCHLFKQKSGASYHTGSFGKYEV